jgi:uncharacterized membrane-anchored protein
MKLTRWTIIFATLITLVGLFAFSLMQKESLLKNGKTVFLRLAPVDPRSLMQGDFMALNIDEIAKNQSTATTKQGFLILKLDQKSIGVFVRWQPTLTELPSDEVAIHYNKDINSAIKIGAESFFFQEGHGDKYAEAKFAAMKVNKQGEGVLEDLYNENLVKIRP